MNISSQISFMQNDMTVDTTYEQVKQGNSHATFFQDQTPKNEGLRIQSFDSVEKLEEEPNNHLSVVREKNIYLLSESPIANCECLYDGSWTLFDELEQSIVHDMD